jgi:probable rRNA maturation factor
VGVLIVDEPTIADLNQRHMGEEGPTDVLAFPIDDEYVLTGRSPEGGSRGPTTRDPLSTPGPLLLGDIVLCPSVAGRNAPSNAGSYPGHRGELVDELDLLAVHGVLHILGLDHSTPTEREAMQARERELLAACRGQYPPPPRSG